MAETTHRPPVVLIVRDGWGHSPFAERRSWNAIREARTPVADRLASHWPSTLIHTSGENVGLPPGTMGNSEVGHQNIGAGRVVDQQLMRINRALREGSLTTNPRLIAAFEHAERSGGRVHLLGLLSDGQVHSDLEHLFAIVRLAAARKLPAERLLLHAFTDGRDTGPALGRGFIERTEAELAAAAVGSIASVSGRYWAMDRDHRWGRVARAWAALTGRATRDPQTDARLDLAVATSASQAVQHYYDSPSEPNSSGDEFITPTRILGPDGQPLPAIEAGDAVIFWNFRGDRPRQISKAFVLDDDAWEAVQGGGFERGRRLEDLCFTTMTDYQQGLPVSGVIFERPERMPRILGQAVSDAGLSQLRCAETEKFPHVTFFFNDYRESPFPGERRELRPSPQGISTYDQKPEMAAHAVCDAVLQRLAAEDREALMVVNFANPDMVGHTGVHRAVVEAVEVVDTCVGAIIDRVLELGGALIVTADHGNAEQTWDPTNRCPHTSHTTFDVPLHLVGERWRGRRLREGGKLADIAPTLLELMGLEQPKEMTGCSLLLPANSS